MRVLKPSMEGIVDQAQLKRLVTYDMETGIFRSNRTGRVIGYRFSNGWRNTYIRMQFGGKCYFAHRLAWLYVTGAWPPGDIDHIDHDGLNNAFSNLRPVTNEVNQKNATISTRNKTGIPGVCWVSKTERWHAWISRKKNQLHLGAFVDFFEACCARKSAELTNSYHPNYGRQLSNS